MNQKIKLFSFTIALIVQCCVFSHLHAQTGAWQQKTDYAGLSTQGAVGFSIGSKGYIGLGMDASGNNPSNYHTDLWQYDPSNDSWTQMTSYPNTARANGICFVIGSVAYVGGGRNYPLGLSFSDLCAFDPAANTWTSKAAMPVQTAYGNGFSAGGKGFFIDGFSSTGNVYCYDPGNDSWSAKNNYPGGGRQYQSSFSIGSNTYVGCGYGNGGVIYNDFYQYDPSNDTWAVKANFGGSARFLAIGAATSTKGYIGMGNGATTYADLWEYDPTVNTWIQKANYGAGAIGNPIAFAIGSNIFAGAGQASNATYGTHTFWEFLPNGLPKPVFSAQPTDTVVCLGAAVTTLTATTDAATYQWYLNNTSTANNFSAIGGATSNAYNISNLAYTDTGLYYLAATNANGTSYSDTVKISVLAATVITGNPASTLRVCTGSGNTITGSASNATSYQWAVNTGSGFTNLSDNYFYTGSTTDSLQISNAITAMSGYQYKLYATGACGTNSTTYTTLTVDSTIITSNSPTTAEICWGGNTTIPVTATGTSLTYQWYVSTGGPFTVLADNFFYTGTTTDTLHINNAITAMSGYQYQLTVSSSCNAPVSNITTLTIDTTIITASPAAATHLCPGNGTTISGTATGAGLTYQWQVKSGTNYTNLSDNYFYSGSTTSTLQLSNVITAMSGYQYRLKVISACNNAFTTATTLTVDTTYIINDLSTKSHICFGGNSSISATAGGAGLTYQWTLNGNNLADNANYSGTHTNTLHVIGSDFTFGGNQYQLNVTGTCGAASTIVTTAVVDSFPLPLAFTPNYTWALQGQVNVQYKTNLDTDVVYNWSYTGTNVSIANSDSSARYTYGVNATSGNVNVFATSPYGCGTTSTISQSIGVEPYDVWTGVKSHDWNDTSNWYRPIVPYGTISAYLPTIITPGVVDTPEIFAATTNACYRFYVQANAGLTIDAGSKLLVNSDATLLGSINGTGILSFTGSAPQTIVASDTVYNLEINNSNGVTLPLNSRVHIKTAFFPTNGTFTNNGTLFLISDSLGTATMNAGSSAGGYVTGNPVNVQKYIHGGRRAYRFLAHPFSTSINISQLTSAFDITGPGGGANGFTTTGTNNPSAFWYNPVTASGSDTDDVTGWIPYTDMTGTGTNAWNQFEGLRAMVRGLPNEGLDGNPYTPSATTINMHGQLAQGDKTTNLISNSNKGYNFIANPYAANIDLSSLSLGSNVGPNFWVWDPNQGTAGVYVSQPLATSYILPAYSSFVVTATAASNNSITFHESGKTTATAANLFKTTGGLGNDVVQLHVYSDNKATSWDRLLIYFNGNASANRDYFDAPKWTNDDLNFYTFTKDNQTQSIDVRPYVNGEVIKLGLKTDIPKDYIINVDNLNVTGTVQLYLHDKYLNKVQQLHQGDVYSFTVNSDANSQGDNRFELNETGIPNGVTNVNAISNLNVNISPNPATDATVLTYAAAQKGATSITVANIMGQQVYSKDMGQQNAGNIVLPMGELTPGIYLVTLKCGNEVITKRVVKN